jgi:bifunctional N-acetylglucosamine-1-phosphate-uridyltransferase/glucosamine-1-phosphate-acetyltransferase GlmU-like protein
LRIPAGVTITTCHHLIDVDVSIGRDTVIRPGTQLLAARIGGCRLIGPDTTLTDHRRREGRGGAHPRQLVANR